ncbi:hypothetical protein CEUSTIGMA_g4232.t1 [Chlamydomonas eustigma]|uniref:TBC1 domain family member 31 n=1 Tax=Chlamydomonas eustigma TaxID=1157962 RepID=A0A250X163_9CHLO|nr:hypothetical protein CEUSTIGMA_g4232.t1 [Chlamydomonas eustigma]|eukprot:GAX76786.1 hypothetical protein CEUSTIGMA_g4232.t1 [Chlamydomonas eustigma]
MSLIKNIILGDANGRLWETQPAIGANGLLTVLCTPSSSTSAIVRRSTFTAVAHDGRAHLLAAVTNKGETYLVNLSQNRFSKVDKTGYAGTAAVFSAVSNRQLFVGFQDCSIRVYDVSKGMQIGVLREHRSPVVKLDVREGIEEMISVAADGIILWDTKSLQRKRFLGNGPYAAIEAYFIPKSESIAAELQDGSFHIWKHSRGMSGLKCTLSFTAPSAPTVRLLQRTFAISPDGQYIVSAGPHLSALLLYNAISGTLLYGVRLPRMENCVEGSTQVAFLPDGVTVVSLCNDRVIRFIDVKRCELMGEVPSLFPCREDCSFAMDRQGNRLALATDGKVLLYDFPVLRQNALPPVPLHKIEPSELNALSAPVLLASNAVHAVTSQSSVSGVLKGSDILLVRDARRAEEAGPRTLSKNRDVNTASKIMGGVQSGLTVKGPSHHNKTHSSTSHYSSPRREMSSFTVTYEGFKQPKVSQINAPSVGPSPHMPLSAWGDDLTNDGARVERLAIPRLQAMLEAYSEFPARYRLLIWDRLLQLPHNTQAFQALLNKGIHPGCKGLASQFGQSLGRPLVSKLSSIMSQLAHWCPLFAESGFVPALVFPFVKLFCAAGATALGPETCFELLVTLLSRWLHGWFDRFPHPPVGILVRMEDLLKFHHSALLEHLGALSKGGYHSLAWSLLSSALSDVLTRQAWLKVWDHCFTHGTDFLYFFTTSYFISLKPQLMALDTEQKLSTYLAGPPTVDVDRLLRETHILLAATPKELYPAQGKSAEPLPQGLVYQEHSNYPAGAVQLFTQERERILEAEEALARRRKVVSELEVRSRAVALQAASMEQERVQLAALEAERQTQLRKVETHALSQMARLDDKVKEQKLKQVVLTETAYQNSLATMRAQWQSQLEALKVEVQHKQEVLAYQVKSRQEEEAIKVLEFQAVQRMRELEHDTVCAAMQERLRKEIDSRLMELQSKQQQKSQAWAAEEESRAVKMRHESLRQLESSRLAQEGAAEEAARKQILMTQLSVQDQLLKAEADRRLRHLAEDEAMLTAKALEVDLKQRRARTTAEEAALQAQAQADLAWFEAEKKRREEALSAQKVALELALLRSQQQLADSEAKSKLLSSQTALLERRRLMEQRNLEEEAVARRAMELMALERSRNVQIEFELKTRAAEAEAKLELARKAAELKEQLAYRVRFGKRGLASTGDDGLSGEALGTVVSGLSHVLTLSQVTTEEEELKRQLEGRLEGSRREGDKKLDDIARQLQQRYNISPSKDLVSSSKDSPTARQRGPTYLSSSSPAATSSSSVNKPDYDVHEGTEPSELEVQHAMRRLRAATGEHVAGPSSSLTDDRQFLEESLLSQMRRLGGTWHTTRESPKEPGALADLAEQQLSHMSGDSLTLGTATHIALAESDGEQSASLEAAAMSALGSARVSSSGLGASTLLQRRRWLLSSGIIPSSAGIIPDTTTEATTEQDVGVALTPMSDDISGTTQTGVDVHLQSTTVATVDLTVAEASNPSFLNTAATLQLTMVPEATGLVVPLEASGTSMILAHPEPSASPLTTAGRHETGRPQLPREVARGRIVPSTTPLLPEEDDTDALIARLRRNLDVGSSSDSAFTTSSSTLTAPSSLLVYSAAPRTDRTDVSHREWEHEEE